jgi:imidazolonepropionase-like amidohydrolase
VIADGHTAPGINAALRAGVDIVDTAPWPDDTSWQLMRRRDATFVPHLYAFARVVGGGPDNRDQGTMPWIPDPVMRRLFEVTQRPPSALRAYREGIRIAVGSDTGVVAHGENARELESLAAMGMRPEEVLMAATLNAARALRIDAETASVSPGKSADLIAVRSSPLESLTALRSPIMVMTRGRLLEPCCR